MIWLNVLCDVLFSGLVDLFMNSELGGKLKPLCLSTMSFSSAKLVSNTAIPWKTLFIDTLHFVTWACFSSKERRQLSSCSSVGCKKVIRFSWMSCMNLALFIIRRFLLVSNRGGGLRTDTSRWHTMLRCPDACSWDTRSDCRILSSGLK